MKKIISLFLIFTMCLSFGICVYADECDHQYVGEKKAADCIHLSRTVYTCSLCGDTYSVNDVDIDTPTSFALVLRTSREDDTLTLTGTLYNNPGLLAARFSIYFDSTVLSYTGYENGTVWSDDAYTGGVNPQSDHLTIYTETETVSEHNTNNGLYFTMTFDVIADGDYGITAKINSKDFNDWQNGGIVYYTPKLYNLAGLDEYGDHDYGEWYTVTESTFDAGGVEERVCSICGNTEQRLTDAAEHWKKGDLNNDSKVNAVDSNLMTSVIVSGTSDIYVRDASDLNSDGHINAVDANLLNMSIVGG